MPDGAVYIDGLGHYWFWQLHNSRLGASQFLRGRYYQLRSILTKLWLIEIECFVIKLQLWLIWQHRKQSLLVNTLVVGGAVCVRWIDHYWFKQCRVTHFGGKPLPESLQTFFDWVFRIKTDKWQGERIHRYQAALPYIIVFKPQLQPTVMKGVITGGRIDAWLT